MTRSTERIHVGRGGTQVTEAEDGPRLVHRVVRLAVVQGNDRGKRWELTGSLLLVGSSRACDVRLDDPAVSGRHCEIHVSGSRLTVRDAGSTNGTFLNGVRVTEAEVPTGARLVVGRTELLIQPREQNSRLRASSEPRFHSLHGDSKPMREVFGVLERVAPTDLGVVILGETGTGKELVARSIHAASARAGAPFVVVDCAAVSDSLSESELFGHEKGAFTGALRDHAGPFEAALGGTVFLDEVGELPLPLQKKLLRVLEARQVRRVGGESWIDVNYRLVAATHRDLESLTEIGAFRQDLYFRMAEVVVTLPPLRERGDDIALLARRLLADLSSAELDASAVDLLCAAPWPGNVRELRNVVRRAATFAPATISADDLRRAGLVEAPPSDGPVDAAELAGLSFKEARAKALAPIERAYLAQLLDRHRPDLDAMAEEAGMHRKSLLRLLREHGLRPEWLPKRPSGDE
jgi:DNA-binding NtrC family response regulator